MEIAFTEFCSIPLKRMQAGTGPLYRLNGAFVFLELAYTESRQYAFSIALF